MAVGVQLRSLAARRLTMRRLGNPETWDQARLRGRSSLRLRLARWRSKRWQVAQCALAAGLAWLIAAELLGHPRPVFAPIAAVVSLGTSYGQRLRRVAEVTAGVAIGVFLGDLLTLWLGSGALQIGLVVALAMTAALLLDGGQLLMNQAAVQSVFVVALLPGSDAALLRWTDALVGGGVALVAATVVPAAALRRPAEQAAVVVRKIAELLRAAAEVMEEGETDRGWDLLADARATDGIVAEMRAAASEGMAVVASSPFRVRHRPHVRRMAELVGPVDRALRSTRVLVRQTAVAAYHRRPVPPSYAGLARDLGEAADLVADELASGEERVGGPNGSARAALLVVGAASGGLERASEMSAEVVLIQLRAVVADLLLVTGMRQIDATNSLPPPPR